MSAGAFRPSALRWWVAFVGLSILLSVFLFAAQWQWGRAAEKEQLASWLAAVSQLPPLTQVDQLRAGNLEGRAAVLRGRWLHDYAILLDNRALEGRPGYWLLTPLELEDGSLVAVLRGWISRGRPGEPLPPLEGLAEQAEVTGELLGRIPRAFELAADPAFSERGVSVQGSRSGGQLLLEELPRRQNVDVSELSAWTGRVVHDWILQQSHSASGPLSQSNPQAQVSYNGLLLHQWPARALDADKHRAYALQWISFAAIAVIALGVLLVRRFRSWRR